MHLEVYVVYLKLNIIMDLIREAHVLHLQDQFDLHVLLSVGVDVLLLVVVGLLLLLGLRVRRVLRVVAVHDLARVPQLLRDPALPGRRLTRGKRKHTRVPHVYPRSS